VIVFVCDRDKADPGEIGMAKWHTLRVPFGGRGKGAWRPAQAPGRHAVALHPWLTSAGEVSRGRSTREANQRVVAGDFDALAPAPSGARTI
jgi:hypothetical protein